MSGQHIHIRGRTMRMAGSAALAVLATLAIATAWIGGAERARHRTSLRSPVGLDEHEDHAPYEVNVDFRGLKDLRQEEHVHSGRLCSSKCDAEPRCAAWTWGRLRNVHGLSDVCFLKEAVPGQKAQRYNRYGVLTSLRPGTPTSEGEAEDDGSAVTGHIKSRDGICLAALEPRTAGGKIEMRLCADGDQDQEWTYAEKTGQIRNAVGLCLSAVDRNKPYVNLHMYPCDTGNWSQQWMYDEPTGIVKSWRGACLDAGERKVDSGMLYIQTCNVAQLNQQWDLGVHGNQPPLKQYPPGTLYCFALMLPGSYEQTLLAMQHKKKVSLFACDEFAVYSNKVIQVAPGVNTSVVNSDLKCGKGGEFGTALNLDIFIAVWTKVIQEARFQHHDWTVKVDPDAVFFPSRLLEVLALHPETKEGTYLNNCKFGLHGPLEVFSRNAVTAWATGSPRCVQHFQKQCGGDCFWGEDLFVDQCLWKVLNVTRDNDFRLLLEDHCEPPADWASCTDVSRVAFHPFKTVEGYSGCLENATEQLRKQGGVAQTPRPSTSPGPPITTTQTIAPATTQRPAAGAAGSHTGSGDNHHRDGTHSEGCHTARPDDHDHCFVEVQWAMSDGIRTHPSWYPESLTPSSSWYDFQVALHESPHANCPMPCKDGEGETAE